MFCDLRSISDDDLRVFTDYPTAIERSNLPAAR
jgi:hypothetical protein